MILIDGDGDDGRSGRDRAAYEGKRVLLVDDNEFNLDTIASILTVAGLVVVCVQSGAAALEALCQGQQFDVVLMDVQMPGMDGCEATRRIRADGRWESLPVLALTANVDPGQRERCLEAGMDDYLIKPVDSLELFRALERWTRSRNGFSF